MKIPAVVFSGHRRAKRAVMLLAFAWGLAAFSPPVPAQVDAAAGPSPAEAEAMSNYQAARAEGRHAEAVKYLLDYMVQHQGENDPLTVSLTQRYGNLLREEGNVRDAVDVLKTARERGIAAFGEYGMELFELNMDLGDAYVDRNLGPGLPRRYYDDALEVLRRNGQRETLLYVTTLMNVAARLTQAGALDGSTSSDTGGVGFRGMPGSEYENLANTGLAGVTQTYRSGYGLLEQYLGEATELAGRLENEDPYLPAKIEVVQAKIRVADTIYLEALPPAVRGSISDVAAKQRYQQQDDILSAAIDVLMKDAGVNRDMLEVAHNARMEVAWLSEEMERMTDFCGSGTVNMAGMYPVDRLFGVVADGTVDAPRFSFTVAKNIFDRSMRRRLFNRRDPDSLPENRPRFIPVCIDGRLMAALVNAPRVTIEEIQ